MTNSIDSKIPFGVLLKQYEFTFIEPDCFERLYDKSNCDDWTKIVVRIEPDKAITSVLRQTNGKERIIVKKVSIYSTMRLNQMILSFQKIIKTWQSSVQKK